MAASEDQNRLDREQNQDSELERYGVWVKAGPEDVDESDAEDEMFTLTDLDEAELDEAEMDLLGSGDEPEPEPIDTTDELEDELDLDSLAFDEEETLQVPEAEPELDSDTSSDEDDEDLLTLEEDEFVFDLGGEGEDLELDELEIETLEADEEEDEEEPVAEPEQIAAADPVADLDLESIGADEPDEPSASEGGIDIDDELPGNLDDLTLDLDSLDVDAFDEPTSAEASSTEETTAIEDELDIEIADAVEEINLESDELNLEEDELDLSSLELDDDTEVAEMDLSSLPGDDDDFSSLDKQDMSQTSEDDLPELEADDGLDDDGLDDEALTLDQEFDDLQAVEDEMTESAPQTESTPQIDDDLPLDQSEEYETLDLDSLAREPEPQSAPAGGAVDEESRSLLTSIEHELSSIRNELSDLKRELSELRNEPHSTTPAPPAESVDEDDAAGGFFEDEGDDDETIALTGAELDNIMNTAEFTEQTGQPTDVDELAQQAAAALSQDAPSDSEAQTDEVDSEAHHPVQEITLEDAPEDSGEIDLDLFGGTEDAVEAAAGLDIDAELADIEELDDDGVQDAADDEELLMDLEIDEEPASQPEEEPPLPDDAPFELGDPMDQLERIGDSPIPENIKGELRSVLNYMDQLLDSLPEEKIQEFAASDHFKVYKRLFEELGLEQ